MPKIFGVPLVDVCAAENSSIPMAVEEMFVYLEEERVLHTEGLFRIPGDVETIKQLRMYCDSGTSTCTIQSCQEINAVAGLLKKYLRELPDPLLTTEKYSSFLAIQKNEYWIFRMTNLRQLVQSLPLSHKNLLVRLCAFLIKVSEHSEANKMSIGNLAILFGPNLLRKAPHSSNQILNLIQMTEDTKYIVGVMQSLLLEFEFLVSCTSWEPKQTEKYNTIKMGIEPFPSQGNRSSRRRAGTFSIQQLSNRTKEEGKGDVSQLLPISAPTEISTPSYNVEHPISYITAKRGRKRRSLDDVGTKKPEDIMKKLASSQLRSFDDFKAKHQPLKDRGGARSPKREEEVDCPKKERRELKKIRAKREEDVDCPKNENELKKIRAKKEKLKEKLAQYRANFEAENGRPVQFARDREPVEKYYAKYKRLKQRMAELEQDAGG